MKLSIITINKNNASGLEKTIQSVVEQTYNDFEYIVIDGASADNSVEVIKKYSSKLNYWVSEPDTGIYNAMNKGIRKAQGDYCLFLNSGDYLVSSTTLLNVFIEINNITQADIYFSNCIRTDGITNYYPDHLTLTFLLDNAINHQNTLIKRSLFLEHDFYNENLNIVSDQEFFLYELWKYKSKFIHMKTNISIFDMHGIGSQNAYKCRAEYMIAYKNVFQELSETIIEIYNYHETIYYNIIKNYGNTKLLVFLLRAYRFLFSRIYKLKYFLKLNSKIYLT
jgi:glycosyltransferase involved in cell wall biosynthesis